MGIIEFILIALVLGVVCWLVFKSPIPTPIKNVVLWAVVIVLVIILVKAFGLLDHDIKIPKL